MLFTRLILGAKCNLVRQVFKQPSFALLRICGPCPEGYSGSGDTLCVDINECAMGTAVLLYYLGSFLLFLFLSVS
jgi:hypothetical protein